MVSRKACRTRAKMFSPLKIGKWIAAIITALVLTTFITLAFLSRKYADLSPEHLIEFEHEFEASLEAETDWAAYLAIEDRLEAELDEKILGGDRPGSLVDRYSASSLTFPGNYPDNWNRSY